ncbi:glycosyltransferase family 4 protein [Jatrophihabitans sp.]|uniref:glycosyltransferase family 4 protein n=1 Tax=Jatrophihabitans sp. TaxID=1932789 RepID=UPI002B9FEC7E|nr:glycosyltransferase family 4 protein [Jatrophihabitans sp.]
MTAVVLCNWRDSRHPEAGGSEQHVETVARLLAANGHPVTILCAKVAGCPADETRDGVRYLRAGGRFGVYLGAAWALLTRRVRPDVVVDVQNGPPWLSRLVTRKPVVVLLHHVHREQWPIVFGRLGSLGWLLESRVAPRVYRRSRYLTVSECTRAELARQGIDPARVTVAYNGTPERVPSAAARSGTPRVVVLGRLVPHKRVEIVIRAAAALRERFPDLGVDIVGQGWWAGELAALARRLGVEDIVTFHGFVDEQAKADLLARAWVGALPSVKEGWGLSVVEAASHGTPSIAFSRAGGLAESILDGQTGVLVDGDEDAYIASLAGLLADRERCAVLGRHARAYASEFSWDATAATFSRVLAEVTGRTLAVQENAGIAGVLERAVPQPATAAL